MAALPCLITSVGGVGKAGHSAIGHWSDGEIYCRSYVTRCYLPVSAAGQSVIMVRFVRTLEGSRRGYINVNM